VQLIAQNPELNVVRVTLQSLGALFGGTQSLHTNSYDEALALPSDDAARLALQTQQVIMEETDLTFAVDPFKGSFLIENMTDQIVLEIESELSKIASLGGALKCIQIGYQVEKIEANAFQIAREIEEGSRKVVGLNFGQVSNMNGGAFATLSNKKITAVSARRCSQGVDFELVQSSLKSLGEIAKRNTVILPSIKNCILLGATIGEICRELSIAWGAEG
jgi:methylmalonyl-CoA mutase N-terminal domain/subunit